MAKIIFNADDLGYSHGVNQGILYCYQHGVVNSTSLMVNMSYFEEAVELISDNHLKNIGLHFNLTEGKPILKTHRTIVDDEGNFLREIHQNTKSNAKEIWDELEAQYLKAIQAGIQINHFDTHHHIHMTQSLRKLFGIFSKRYNMPLRKVQYTSRNPIKRFKLDRDLRGTPFYTKNFSSLFYGENATEENLLKLLNNNKGKDLEIMCHPGYLDEKNGEYNNEREVELQILTSGHLTEFVKNNILENYKKK